MVVVNTVEDFVSTGHIFITSSQLLYFPLLTSAMKPWLGVVLTVTLVPLVAAQEVSEAPQPWWKSMVLYQVYPRSFKDTNGDGVGDLKGITQMASYFKELGVTAVSILPFYPSPMSDLGFDISNHTDVDPLFGTMQDFDDLVAKFRELDIKLLVDFVPNHTSDEHPWFKKSVNKDPGFKDFYIWMDPKFGAEGVRLPPNNWMSAFGGPAWEWNEKRHQYYLHIYHKKMPDLNYRNPAVVSNMTDVLRFWLDKGVDGFRMSAEAKMFKDARFPDAPPVPGTRGDTYLTQDHRYYTNLPETFTQLRKWADLVYKWVQEDNRDRVITMEVYNDMAANYYGPGNESLELPFCFNLMWHVNQGTRPIKYKQLIEDWMSRMPQGDVATWTVGNHDQKRIPNRYGSEMIDAINLLTGVLPGIKVTYYGEEIGMKDTFLLWEQILDPAGLKLGPQNYMGEGGTRDPCRTPMQWDNTTSAGFSSASKTWLPVNPNYWRLNVDIQKKADNSHFKVFKAMVEARNDPVLKQGTLDISVPNNDTLVVIRRLHESYFLLVINMGSEIITFTSPVEMSVVTASINSGYSPGQHFKGESLAMQLRPKAAVLLKTLASTESSGAAKLFCLSSSLTAAIISLVLLMT